MNEVIDVFGQFSASQVITFCAAVAAILTFLVKGYKKVVTFHDSWQARESILDEIALKLNMLDELKDSMEELRERQDKFEYETKKHNLNNLRDRLLQMHRYFTNKDKNPMQAWSDFERDAFLELYNDYQYLGGNGHMKTNIYPEMMSLEVVSFDEPKYAEMMQKRKG